MRNFGIFVVLAVLIGLPVWGCEGDSPVDGIRVPLTRINRDRTYLRDEYGRYLMLNGINLSGSTKVPNKVGDVVIEPKPDHMGTAFNNGEPSYVGEPWSVEGCGFVGENNDFDAATEDACDAAIAIRKLRNAGFNSFRFLINWEGIEHGGRGVYDREYLETIAKHIKIARYYGVYMLLDMHQDAYSRHLVVQYNEHPTYVDDGKTIEPDPGSIEGMILSLLPGPDGQYTDAVRGEGAPKWAVQACLYEKDMESPNWGKPRLLNYIKDNNVLLDVANLYTELSGGDSGDGGIAIPAWAQYILDNSPDWYDVQETSDLLPFTNWGVMAATSVEVGRNFACLLAGDTAFPGQEIDGMTIQDYLQSAYAASWVEVVKTVRDFNGGKVPDNVVGYDIINEPIGNMITLAVWAAALTSGISGTAKDFLVDVLGPEYGDIAYRIVTTLGLIPEMPTKPGDDATDTEKDAWKAKVAGIRAEWGAEYADLIGITGMNVGFNKNYMVPFYERVGKAILAEDPDAVIFFEPSMSIENILGSELGGGMWDQSMTEPQICVCEMTDADGTVVREGVSCQDPVCESMGDDNPDILRSVLIKADTVFAPHYYADIYPFIGFNAASRVFSPEEVRYRDYAPFIDGVLALGEFSLSNIPVVLGEFGTYYNFTDIDYSEATDYEVSAHILDNYYEALETLMGNRMLWCYTPDNHFRYGDWWNKEDFSIWKGWKVDDATGEMKYLGQITDGSASSDSDVQTNPARDGEFRAELAWSRPFPMFLAGKPVSMHFYSPYHYFDQIKDQPDPEREFEVIYESRESVYPSEIYVPESQYPDGFFVWVSDGHCHFDPVTRTLFHFPGADKPDALHSVRLLPPINGIEQSDWQYFFNGEQVVER